MNSAITNINAIAKRELSAYFSSAVAYVFIVIFLLLTGFFTFMEGRFFERGLADLESFFMWHPWLYLFLVPCVGMRLWAEERRVGTIELLLTKPITAWQAIVGKFLASWLFLAVALALTFPLLITVNYLGRPDNGTIVAAYLGSLLMAGAYLSVSCLTSAMTRNQVISFILSVVICLFLVLCGFPPVTNLLTRVDKPWVVDLVSSLSVMTHFQPFTTGILDSRDVIFFLLLIAFALFTTGVIVRSHRATSIDKLMKRNFETLFYSTAGVAAMFVTCLAFYVVTSTAKVRLDVSADKIHTLSTGTKRILAKLDSQVTIRFYCTQDDTSMPPALRTYARHVEELLHEYQQEAAKGSGKLILEKFDPKPDSDIEEAARLNGIEGQTAGQAGADKFYLGLVVSLLDQKFVLPVLPPERERLLEYDLSRAITGVITARPVIGIMTGLPVFGDAPDPLMRPIERHSEWAFITELKKDFTLKEVPLTASNIDEQINVLLVVHPVNISDAAQYAIDQFVLRGGKLAAFLDPHAYFDQTHERSQSFSIGGDNAGRSSLDKLLKAWGLNMDVNRVAADTTFAGRNLQTGDSMPTLLLVTRDGIDQNEAATSQIDNLVFPFAGVFNGTPAEGLKQTVLVKCSANSELVDGLMATASSDRILRSFKSSNVEYPLAVHLSGHFKTAFPPPSPGPERSSSNLPDSNFVLANPNLPKGSPSPGAAGEASVEKEVSADRGEGEGSSVPNGRRIQALPNRSPSPGGEGRGEGGRSSNSLRLSESSKTADVILVADTDMLNDKVCVRVQNVMGRPVFNAVNGNLNFVQSIVEQLSGDDDLISSRSRASMIRPFTRVKKMEAQAGRKWQEKLQVLETKQREAEQQMRSLQARNSPASDGQQQPMILSPEQEKELENYQKTLAEVGRDLKQVRKNLRHDTEALEFHTKLVNIGAMPFLVAIAGSGLAAVKTRRRSAK